MTARSRFVALFVLLRLVDDLDDLNRDHACESIAASQISSLRKRLAGCLAILPRANYMHPHALIGATAAIALVFAAPFGLQRLLPQQLALGSLVFEGGPPVIFVYVYCRWRHVIWMA